MKVSPAWLQNFFTDKLPKAEGLVEALTFHVAEVEEVEKDFIDLKVLPDRAAYMLCHRGVAYELSAILGMEMKDDPLRDELPEFSKTSAVTVTVDDPLKCTRYMAGVVRGVKVGSSPEWLQKGLESVGQRSINNIVDATNYVMLNIGQPLHAFDMNKLQKKGDAVAITVRMAKNDETITTLSGEEYTLSDDILLITDGNSHAPIGIAGVKGGKSAEITNDTTDIIIESANFDGTLVRRASQKLKLWTDASLRFQNRPSSELAAYGMRDVLKLVTDIAGGEVEGVVDVYAESAKVKPLPVAVSLSRINSVLGTSLTAPEVVKVFGLLDLVSTHEDDTFLVTPPFERRDIVIPEDLIEEVGRIIGYDKVPATPLPQAAAANSARFRGIERVKDFFTGRGFTEISTQTFARTGDVVLSNPLDQTMPALRTSLSENMQDALRRATNFAPRVLGPLKPLKLFEIGTVFIKDRESLVLMFGAVSLKGGLQEAADALKDEFAIKAVKVTEEIFEASLDDVELEKLGESYKPKEIRLGEYHQFSQYPFALRDVAIWTPVGTEEDEVKNVILEAQAKENLLLRIDLFDKFGKEVKRPSLSASFLNRKGALFPTMISTRLCRKSPTHSTCTKAGKSASMDYITVDSLRIVGKHGHFEQERRVEQEFIISLRVGFDAKPAGKSDELTDTIDFDVLKNIVERSFAEKSRYLVEALAEEIAQKILVETPAQEAIVSIQKTAVWPNGVPGVTVTRSK